MRRSPGSGGQLAAVAAVLAICILFPAPASASLSKWKNYVGGAYGTVPNTTIGYGEEMYRGFYVLDANPDYVVGPVDDCYCHQWAMSHGTDDQKMGAIVAMFIVMACCIVVLMFYAYAAFRATCGWEEVYVCIVELAHVCIAIWHETESPATLYLSTGNQALWLRYAEWLLSCPVILIHLSNLTGMKDDYSKRTMGLLITDIGCIVFGSTAAFAPHNYVKIILWFIALCYGCTTYFLAAKVYIEAYHTVPKGICRKIVRFMAWDYFGSWCMFPILFVLGPEGFGHITAYGSVIAHQVLDITSKNMWSFSGHFLRIKIHEHIILHGNITKKTKITVAGAPVEVEEYVDPDDVPDEEKDKIEDKGTKALANRQSFIIMKDRMQAQGMDVRASLDGPDDGKARQMEMGAMDGGKMGGMGIGGMGMMGMGGMGMGGMGMGGMGGMGAALEPGRVIICLPDMSLVEFFRQQFASLPAAFEVYPAIGPDMALQLAQQSLQLGGTQFVDFVLLAPDYLHNRSPTGLVGRLKSMGMRVAAYGWQPAGPLRELVEGSPLDGFLAGPTAPQGIDRSQFMALVSKMQQMKKMGSMGGGMGMGMGGMGVMGTMSGNVMSSNAGAMASATPRQSTGMASAGGAGGLANPLFNAPPSPLMSQAGMMGVGAGMGGPAAPSAGPEGEAAMMQQLMAEINQLRAELQQ